MPEADHSDACTTRGSSAPAAAWRTPHPPAPAAHSETPGPMPHTTGIPIYRAWKGRPRYIGETTRGFGGAGVRKAAGAEPDLLPANRAQRSDKTAWTKAFRQEPAA